jgi:hypothetical protein
LESSESPSPSADHRLKELRLAREKAQSALMKQTKNPRKLRNLDIGQQVWLDACNLKVLTASRKLSPRRYGPFPIKQKISEVAYRISLPPSMKIHDVFHVDLLTPYAETSAYGKPYLRPPPETIDGEEEYEVEDILMHRKTGRNQKLQYLVKWKGYPSSENSWVDDKDLHAPEILEKYKCPPTA